MTDTLYQAPVTVLGIGNVILRDEGFGVRVVEYLAASYDFPETVQLVDGGTLGIELTHYVTGSEKLLVIDSIDGGEAPGSLFFLRNDEVEAHFQNKISAHEVGIQDVLSLLAITGKKIPEVVVIGAQPFDLTAGVGLSENMGALIEPIARRALQVLAGWGISAEPKTQGASLDFSVVAEAQAK